jgi:two-component system phosphate regulon response regulator OmpR
MPRVLIIDDEPPVRAALRAALEAAGHAVREAADGAAGVALYWRDPADVVVCDLIMPGLDGLGAMRHLRRLDPGVRLVAITGGPTEPGERLSLGRGMGAVRLLRKPFRVEEAVAAVDEALAAAVG